MELDIDGVRTFDVTGRVYRKVYRGQQLVLFGRYDEGGTADLDLRLRVAAEVGDRLLGYAYQQPDKADRARLIAEMKRLLSGYLFPAST